MRRRVSRGTAAARRRLVWARSTNVQTGGNIHTSGTRTFNLLSDYESLTGADAAGVTVMGIRGRVWGTREQSATTPTILAWGVTVTPASVGTPADYDVVGLGRYMDWMARDYIFMPAGTPAATSQLFPVGNVHDYPPLNVRSRRRIPEVGQTLSLVATWPTSSAFNIGLWYSLDVLLALP